MIIDLWMAPINPDKEAEAVETWKKSAQIINKTLGTNYRVMRPDSGLALRILLVGELESHAARESAMLTLNENEEWQAHYDESLEKNVADHTRIEHYCYNVVE